LKETLAKGAKAIILSEEVEKLVEGGTFEGVKERLYSIERSNL